MSFSVKQISEQDWREFKRLRLKSLSNDPSVFGSNYAKESVYTEDRWRETLRSVETAVFLIYEGETSIGITCISIDRADSSKKTAILWGTWLEPNLRRKGISVLMYQARIDWAKRQPTIEKILVAHRESNLSSKFANQKHGFEQFKEEDFAWSDGTDEKLISYQLVIKR